jgi:hypothetical protein
MKTDNTVSYRQTVKLTHDEQMTVDAALLRLKGRGKGTSFQAFAVEAIVKAAQREIARETPVK